MRYQGNAKHVFCVVFLAEIYSAVTASAECDSAGRTDWKVCLPVNSVILFPHSGSMQPVRLRTVDRGPNFPAGQGPKAYYKAPMLAGIVIGAVEAQKISSAVYFAVAAVLIFVAAMLAGRKVQRNLKAKWIAAIFAVSMATFGLIWVLLSALNRHEAEPRTPPDYPAPSATP